jgi:hypothetical protein
MTCYRDQYCRCPTCTGVVRVRVVHDEYCDCIHCESVGTGFMRVMRWLVAAIVGFIGGGIAIIAALYLLARVLR